MQQEARGPRVDICPDCFDNDGLKRRIVAIRKEASEGNCQFHPTKKGVPIARVASIVDPVFRDLYWATGDDGNYWSQERGSSLHDVIYDLTEADDDQVINGLIGALEAQDNYWPPDGEEPFYSTDYLYTLQREENGRHLHNWQSFQRSLMFESRFFNPDAERMLNEIFHGVQQLRDANRQGPVYMIQPDTPEARFFRARNANSYEEMKRIRADLAKELGPPPEQLRKAGRLNPSGIHAFYGAFDLATCIAELRPSVGGRVISAEFSLVRPICVLDTTRFANNPKTVNLFAAGGLERARQWQFMKMFMEEIARPVFPGEEHLQYLPTQAVAEFLNRRFQVSFAREKRGIDAVIFRSAQRPEGKNIVVLGDAAIVGMPAGAAGEVPAEAPEKDDFDDWFDQALKIVRADKPAGLVADPQSVRWTKIIGAEFTPAPDDGDDEAAFDLQV